MILISHVQNINDCMSSFRFVPKFAVVCVSLLQATETFFEMSINDRCVSDCMCVCCLLLVSNQPICGNRIMEKGEECDVGLSANDPCCYSSKEPIEIQCRLKPNKQCRLVFRLNG